MNLHHYDLLARENWKATSVLIVSPYVESQFFKRVIKDIRPEELTVILDDGCRPEDVTMIESLRGRGRRVCAAIAGTRGLVHAKIFYVEWLTPGGQRAHTLVYGSGNATRQAFDGDFNSELMCKTILRAEKHKEVLKWIDSVRRAAAAPGTGEEIGPLRDALLADGVHVRLPAMTIKNGSEKASNFDLWLQRGRFVSAFRPDPSFLRVHVALLQQLPPGVLEQTVQGIGFEIPKTQRLSIAYVANPSLDLERSTEPGNWRSRLCLRTQLGDWCSETCHRENGHLFRKSGYRSRERDLLQLSALKVGPARNQSKAAFLDRVEKLWTVMGDNAQTYLKAVGGRLALDFYAKSFDQRVSRDLELIGDKEFCRRYVDGFEVIDVPRFRLDAKAWKGFVDSFASQLHQEAMKQKSQSLIFQRLRDTFEDDEDTFEPNKLINRIRSNWNNFFEYEEKKTLGNYMDGYHLQDE